MGLASSWASIETQSIRDFTGELDVFQEVRLEYDSNRGGWNIDNNNIPSLKLRTETWAEQHKTQKF